jgi:hypothetical protein
MIIPIPTRSHIATGLVRKESFRDDGSTFSEIMRRKGMSAEITFGVPGI